MIYGEESEEIVFNNGLWISESSEIPAGFAFSLKNLIVTPKGTLVPRKSMIGAFSEAVSVVATEEIYVDDVLPYRSFPYYPMFYTKPSVLNPNSALTNIPIFIEPHPTISAAVTVNIRAVNGRVDSAGDYASKINHRLANGYPASNWVQYSDRIYAFFSGVGVKKLSGWDFTTASNVSLTETLIAGSPNLSTISYSYVTFLDLYKDRLFLTIGNRVYYTDTAAPGGYPETWNTASGFFTVASPSISYTTVFNNIMYLFTPTGVWSLQVNGPPASWLLRKINETINVNHAGAVCFNQGLFYYIANNNDIHAWNTQDNPNHISGPIDEYLATCQGVGIFAFEDGCIVCAETYKPSEGGYNGSGGTYSADPTKAVLEQSRLFYFDGNVWTELTLFDQDVLAAPGFTVIIGSSVLVQSTFTNQKPATYLTVLSGMFGDYPYLSQTYYVDPLNCWGDADISDPTDGTVTVTKPVVWELVPATLRQETTKNKRVKMGFLNITSIRDETLVEVQQSIDGNSYEQENPLVLTKEVDTQDRAFLERFEVDTFARRLKIKFVGKIPQYGGDNATIPTADQAITIPVKEAQIEINSVTLVYNTGRREDEDDS